MLKTKIFTSSKLSSHTQPLKYSLYNTKASNFKQKYKPLLSYIMQTDISVNHLPSHETALDLKADLNKDQPLEFTDWSSVDDIIDLSR